MQRRAALLALGCALLASDAFAQRLTTPPPTGTFVMRAGLAGQHPRLHFTAAEIPDLRAQGLGARNWFLTRGKAAFGGYKNRPPELLHDWHDYLYGLWAQIFMDLAFLVEQDQAWADTAKAWALFFARNQNEWLDDDLVPMEITTGMALTYDILYDQFTPAERGELRAALYFAADFIYDRFFVGDYWTQDFQNNHMHNRIHGLAHAAFAIYGDDPLLDVQPHADLAMAAFDEVVAWLPEDGSTHEGPGYWDYGYHWVVRTAKLLAHVTDEDPAARNPHFANDLYYRIYLTTPGWQQTFGLGDSGDGAPYNMEVLAVPTAATSDPHGAAVLRELMQVAPSGFYQQVAWGLLWYDGDMAAAPYDELPRWRFWPDLEMLSVRSSWLPDATALVFKCGPPGGHRMQSLRVNDDWVNIAHDHPDQNHFLLFSHGVMLAQDDGYPQEQKLSRSHNAVVVDGEGGPREGTAWYQPFPYAETAGLDDVFLAGATALATGNAGALYLNAETALRHLFFVDGEYLVLFDELDGGDSAPHEFDWRLHKDGVWATLDPTTFTVTAGPVRLWLRFLEPSSTALTASFLPAELTAPPSLSVVQRAPAARFLSLLVPQQYDLPVLTAQTLASGSTTSVRVDAGERADFVVVSNGAFTAGDLGGTARLTVARTRAQTLEALWLARATAITYRGAPVLASDVPINSWWRGETDGVSLELEAPYRATTARTVLTLGNLIAKHRYAVTVDGAVATPVDVDGAGVAALEITLSQRHRVRLTDDGPTPAAEEPPQGEGELAGGCDCAAATPTVGWSWLALILLCAGRRRR